MLFSIFLVLLISIIIAFIYSIIYYINLIKNPVQTDEMKLYQEELYKRTLYIGIAVLLFILILIYLSHRGNIYNNIIHRFKYAIAVLNSSTEDDALRNCDNMIETLDFDTFDQYKYMKLKGINTKDMSATKNFCNNVAKSTLGRV
jgi:predicted Holliday junction resolvase-like endonuclease